jgi:LPXTG-motif cell wall-anchored protein
LYVIPTDIQGVYVRDDLNAPGHIITGKDKVTARKIYEAQLDAYLGTETQKNVVTTPVNGKVVVLGLDKGTYYLKETEAPDGYNPLHSSVSVDAGTGTTEFFVYATSGGIVADVQAEDATYTENVYHITRTVVENSRGVELPSTGGEGTFWLITVGALLAICFAVFLITHKKMSVYTD